MPLYICLIVWTFMSLANELDPLKIDRPTQIDISITKRKQTGDRTFTVASSIEWNKLPLTLRQSPSIETFKKSLKTHLF